MKYNRAGDLEHIEAGDGDKPVKAERLLFKRLHLLHPSLKKERGPAPDRRTLIYGLVYVGAKDGSN